MAGTIGGTTSNVTTTTGNKTVLLKYAGSPATVSGLLYRISVYMDSAATIKVKVFRDDGTNYNFIGEDSFAASAGLNSNIDINDITVQAGDLIALFVPNGTNFTINGGSTNACLYKNGDITTDSLKTSWSDLGYSIYILTGDIVESSVSPSEIGRAHV